MPRLIAAFLLALVAVATVSAVVHADPLDDETRRIGKQLQCPVCSGTPVSDSPSDLAGQMRAVIRTKLEAGESEQQIIAYFVERYGDSILVEPPRRGFGLAVWLAPIVMIGVGGLLLWRLCRLWMRDRWSPAPAGPVVTAPHRNGAATTTITDPASPAERARAELERFRRES
jgi:cytochrome c-type biogenesis protein CcmH